MIDPDGILLNPYEFATNKRISPTLVELASGLLKDLSNNKVAEDRMSKIAIVGNETDLTAALSASLE